MKNIIFKRIMAIVAVISMLLSLGLCSYAAEETEATQDDTVIIDDNLQDNVVTNSSTNVAYSYVGGIGGKAEDDMAATFTVGNTASANMPRIHIGSNVATDASALTKNPYTIKFKVYADGNATAAVNYRWKDASDTYRLFRWYPDGTYSYNVDGTLVSGGTLARGQWHDIAVVYCSQNNKYQLYVNDELQEGYSGSIAGTYYSLVYMAMEDGSTNGTIAYSDFEAYYGYYVPPFKPTVKNLLAGMSSANSRVAVTSDTIAVFSHPTNTAYQINSDDVVSALTPIEGWTLSYVNSNKTETTVSHVKSGYIKASHDDYDDVYIPVACEGDVIDNNFSDNAVTYKGTTKATYAYADGVAIFTAGETAIDGYTYAGIGNSVGSADALAKVPYTLKFKMKVTGDAVGVVNYRWDGDNYNIIRINGDGSYTHMNNANTQVSGGTLQKDTWHDITVVYDSTTDKYQLWVNDECKITDLGTLPTNYYSRVVFAIATGSANGTVSFKDFDTYYGYYYPPFIPTVENLLTTMSSDNAYVVVGSEAISVFSHPTNAAYQLSSSDVLSALTVEDGWVLSYVNNNKETAAEAHVKEGYIKASHEQYDDIYIPITHKGATIDNDHSDNAVTHKGTTKATYAYSDGVMSLTAGATAMDAYSFTGIGAGAGQAGAMEKLTYTIGFKMMLTGDAIGTVNYRWDGDGFELLRWEADGSYKYRSGANLVSGSTLSKDQWHDIVIVYDSHTNKYQIWIDDECIETVANCPTNYHSKLVFAIATGSANGTVSFKDFDTYYGYYYAAPVTQPAMTLSDVSCGTKTTFTVNLESSDECAGLVYVAIYTVDGSELVSVVSYDATEQRSVEADTPNGEIVKVMWWTDETEATPITESEIVALPQQNK